VEQNEQDVTPGSLACNDVAGQTVDCITKKKKKKKKRRDPAKMAKQN
jgi:hypothetical protein